MKFKLIGCQVFMRELYMLAAHSPHSVHIRWMPTDLHTQPQKDLRPALQAEIDKIEQESDPCDAILLGYGLCSMGTVGLKSKSIPLIIPRAHDCITMLWVRANGIRRFSKNTAAAYTGIHRAGSSSSRPLAAATTNRPNTWNTSRNTVKRTPNI